MPLLNKIIKITQGYRTGESALVIWEDEENQVCKVQFNDDEFHGYDINDVTVIQSKNLEIRSLYATIDEYGVY